MFMVMKPRERFCDARNISAYDSGNDPKPMQPYSDLPYNRTVSNNRTGWQTFQKE